VPLDTHIFLSHESGSPRLAPDIRKRIVDFDSRGIISAPSFREIASL